MKAASYPAYKPTGADWLGKVPFHWEQKRLKYCVSLLNEKVNGQGTDLPYIGLENIESWTGQQIQQETEPPISEGQSNLFKSGDVLFGKLRPYLAKVLRAKENGICTGELLVLRPKEAIQDYLFYYILARNFIQIVDSSTYGAKMPRANWDFIGDLPMLIPGDDEQRDIAAFLELETARIDAIIVKKEQLIELLHEKRTALISHAVTKGLDIDVPMKDSGVDWLDVIPEYWNVKPLKFNFTFLNSRRVPLSSEERAEMTKEYPYYGASGIIDHVDDFIFDEPLILVAEDGANLFSRSTPLAFIASGKYWVNNHAHILRPIEGPIDYWSYLLASIIYDPWITGSAQPKLTKDNLGSIHLPVPSKNERTGIVEFLNRETSKLDSLIAKIRITVGKLNEYRSALISAAVTGKIDVRQEAT